MNQVCNYQGDGNIPKGDEPYPSASMLSLVDRTSVVLVDNAALKAAVEEIGVASLPSYRYVEVPSSAPLPYPLPSSYFGRLLLPPNFDETASYPVLVTVYGGPASQAVTRRFPSMSLSMYLASEGVIVAEMDGRGTDARGEGFRKSVYRQLGVLETIDQVHKDPCCEFLK